MNTRSQKYGNLIKKYPEEQHAIERIQELYNSQDREYPLIGLFDLASPSSSIALGRILDALIELGELQKIFRVTSRSDQGGIEDYNSIYEVPDEIYDWRGDCDLKIKPENIRVIYQSV